MSLTLKRIIMVTLGVLGACMVWPCLLAVQYYQTAFPGYLFFSLAQGMLFGLFFGAIFGSFEGIVVSSRPKAFKGLALGAAAGLVAGATGVLAGQSFLFRAAEEILSTWESGRDLGIVAANGVGWALIGLFVAMIEGFRSRSARKLLVGLAGGIVGGVMGGAALQALLFLFPSSQYALLAGLVLFGFFLSFCYSFFENRFSWGSVKLLNGPLKNKEYHLVKARMSVGTKSTCDIVLEGYRDVEPVHAWIGMRKGRMYVTSAQTERPLKVNEERTNEAQLRREDVIAVGSAKFMYGIFS